MKRKSLFTKRKNMERDKFLETFSVRFYTYRVFQSLSSPVIPNGSGLKLQSDTDPRYLRTISIRQTLLGGGFKYFFHFHPYLGKISNLTHVFWSGLKPPTSLGQLCFWHKQTSEHTQTIPSHKKTRYTSLQTPIFASNLCIVLLNLKYSFNIHNRNHPDKSDKRHVHHQVTSFKKLVGIKLPFEFEQVGLQITSDTILGGGFKYLLSSPLIGEDFQFD